MSHAIDIARLSPRERLDLIRELWESLEPRSVPVTPAQIAELDRRLDELEADPHPGIPWEVVFRSIRDRAS